MEFSRVEPSNPLIATMAVTMTSVSAAPILSLVYQSPFRRKEFPSPALSVTSRKRTEQARLSSTASGQRRVRSLMIVITPLLFYE